MSGLIPEELESLLGGAQKRADESQSSKASGIPSFSSFLLGSLQTQPASSTGIPPVAIPPTRANSKAIADAARRFRARKARSGLQSTILGGQSGGPESVVKKTLIGQ